MANDNNKIIRGLLEIIKHKVGLIEGRQADQSVQIQLVKGQQSVINEKLDGLEDKVDAGFKVLKKNIRILDKKTDKIMEFASYVDEDLQDHKKRLNRIERIPVIASVLNQ